MTRFVEALTRMHVYEVRLRKDKRRSDFISDARALALKLILLLDLVLSGISFASAQPAPSSPAPHQSGKPKALAVYAPRPNYPKDTQGRRLTGSGIVVMEVDNKTGLVKSARMEKSTGNKLLDDAALQAFSQWRFKPGSISRIHCPITFWRNGSGIRHRMTGAVISD
jgi:TonB family protein